MKAIIFDASTLISFAMNGLFDEIEKLKKIFDGKFIITKEVKKEVIDKPLNIKKFELEALRLKKLYDAKVLESPASFQVNDGEISRKTEELLNFANNSFQANGKNIKIVDLGEISCIALSKILTEKGIQNIIAVDERTMRMLGEKPENLGKLLEKKLHTRVSPNRKNFDVFKGLKFIRSTELIYVAYKKGLIDIKDDKLLDALLYSMKFKGAAVSGEEIEEIKRLK